MTLDERQQYLIDNGLARIHSGRLIPIMRGGDETPDEKEEREAREKAEREAAAKTFTQDEVNRMIQERLARDRRERPTDEEIAALREAKTKLDELESNNASELEKAQRRAEKAEADAAAARELIKETTLRSAILAEASKADRKVVDPEAVLTLLDKKALTLDDSGNPTNIAEAMDALLTAKPYLVGGGSNGTRDGADQGSRGGGGGDQLASVDGMSAEEIAEAVAAGKLDTYMSSKT